MSTINERIQCIINERFEGNTSAFCRSVDVKQPTMNTIIGERQSKPSFEIISSIANADALKGLSLDWLISGKGVPFPANEHLPTNTNGKGVPYFEDIEASCSILSMNMETPENPTFYIDYEHFNDCNAYIPVVGDSMYPQYCAGEIVAVKQISNFDVIQWGEAYLIVTNSNANDLRTIKQIHYSDDESKIILRASNPNYKGDTKINKEDILSMFIIKGKIKRNQL